MTETRNQFDLPAEREPGSDEFTTHEKEILKGFVPYLTSDSPLRPDATLSEAKTHMTLKLREQAMDRAESQGIGDTVLRMGLATEKWAIEPPNPACEWLVRGAHALIIGAGVYAVTQEGGSTGRSLGEVATSVGNYAKSLGSFDFSSLPAFPTPRSANPLELPGYFGEVGKYLNDIPNKLSSVGQQHDKAVAAANTALWGKVGESVTHAVNTGGFLVGTVAEVCLNPFRKITQNSSTVVPAFAKGMQCAGQLLGGRVPQNNS